MAKKRKKKPIPCIEMAGVTHRKTSVEGRRGVDDWHEPGGFQEIVVSWVVARVRDVRAPAHAE